jgi:hypothetical protein
MTKPTAVELLREIVGDLPTEAEDHALAALAVLADPGVAAAAMDEQLTRERLEAAKPHLVRKAVKIVAVPVERRKDGTRVTGTRIEGSAACPDCGRGAWSDAGVLVCAQLPRVPTELAHAGKPGDLIACGMER